MEAIAQERFCGRGTLQMADIGLQTKVNFEMVFWENQYDLVSCPNPGSQDMITHDPSPSPQRHHLHYRGRANTLGSPDCSINPESFLDGDAIIECEPGTVLPRGLARQIRIVVRKVPQDGGKVVFEFTDGN